MDAFGEDSKPVGFETSSSEVARRYGAIEAIPSESLDYRDTATIVAGFTHDGGPEPADYLKQVIAASNTGDYLASQGIEPEIKYILADEQSEASQNELERRLEVLESFNSIYGDHDAEVVSQSSLSSTDYYQEIIEQSMNAVIENEDFAEAVRTALPPEMREKKDLDGDPHPEHVKRAGRYALEEAVTVVTSDADIKVGPPMEIYFDSLVRDEAFREIAGIEDEQELVSLITSPSLPACKSFSHGSGEPLPENGKQSRQQLRQEGGVTPYKNSFTRVELRDSPEDIQAKLEAAPLEQEIDMSLIAEELESRNPTGEVELSNQLSEHLHRLSPEPTDDEQEEEIMDDSTTGSMYSYGGDI